MSAATPVPTPEQLAWQRLEVGAFFHVGVNTFAGLEWSDGTLAPETFAPTDLDAGGWLDVAVAGGARYAILTAKHHDGFCLWPTETTDYSVASSPWRGGDGDLVREFVDACRERGVLPGLYLSPWDRHDPRYPDPAAYMDVYVAQLTELCTRYGPLVEIWFDGAGSEGYTYDWSRIMGVVREHQPQAMVFNMGTPTIRWVGNEDGLAADPVEYVVADTRTSNYTADTVGLARAAYLPPECDVSVRRGWFWSADDEPKTLEHLLGIYYRSVGLGANLLLNVPPDARGRIDPADDAVVRAFGAEVRRRFSTPVDLESSTSVDHLRLHEDLTHGQRVATHEIEARGAVVARGLTVGAGRLHVLAEPVPARELRIRVTGQGAALAGVEAFATGHTSAPDVPADYRAPTERPDAVV
ncbi:Alpha-L-fucosidase [Beutenbergia cavernae DSM 12333]|uniref:alpha-L-fucosidase n=1 Tax=Beutenbergia cavernae (strain ATCC BAA-8 / DSM 12333 / CCUG 43141 / JCM 11478 / NBRC 16432 / NCIMB 13614 / HKI 0122) TaxID=471853 RepID=C5C2L9_BEUC1|nr:alpha-L-fucosidase [Beutenbergia cavernae]ACQ79705.1 Alpha-L-fucosidase [Beutenbergia cavernae DSM 12333]